MQAPTPTLKTGWQFLSLVPLGFFETGTPYIVQAYLEPVILLLSLLNAAITEVCSHTC
jgi:hypothetical protein